MEKLFISEIQTIPVKLKDGRVVRQKFYQIFMSKMFRCQLNESKKENCLKEEWKNLILNYQGE